jgi:hypothetical protein
VTTISPASGSRGVSHRGAFGALLIDGLDLGVVLQHRSRLTWNQPEYRSAASLYAGAVYWKLSVALLFILYNAQRALGRGWIADQTLGLVVVLWVMVGLTLLVRRYRRRSAGAG